MIDYVIFDLGGVVVDWNPRYLYRQLFENEAEMESFLTNVANGEWNEQQDAGRPFHEAVSELTTREPKYASQIRAFHERWPEMMKGAIPGTPEIIEQLAREKKARLFALSNWSAETFPHALKRFEVFRHFESILVSGQEKLIKPDPRFFKLLETRFGIVPSRSVFIDDVEKNVNAAKSLGYYAHLFRDSSSLRTYLTELGVLGRDGKSTN